MATGTLATLFLALKTTLRERAWRFLWHVGQHSLADWHCVYTLEAVSKPAECSFITESVWVILVFCGRKLEEIDQDCVLVGQLMLGLDTKIFSLCGLRWSVFMFENFQKSPGWKKTWVNSFQRNKNNFVKGSLNTWVIWTYAKDILSEGMLKIQIFSRQIICG